MNIKTFCDHDGRMRHEDTKSSMQHFSTAASLLAWIHSIGNEQ